MSAPQRILVIRLSSLGDILHALPAFQSLRRAHPEARIDWLVEERMRFLLTAVPGIDEIHSLDTHALRREIWSRKEWSRTAGLIRRLRARRYDLTIDFQGLLKTAFLSWMSGAPGRIGFPRQLVREWPAHWFYTLRPPTPTREVHVTRLNLLLAHEAGGSPDSSPVRLQAARGDREAVEASLSQAKLSRFVVINPGGGWITKRWDPAKYGLLAARIRRDLNLPVVITTGPEELNLYETIRRSSGENPPMLMQVPFLQLIPLLSRAHLLVSGDTGPYHLACAMGVPVVGIFGPTSPVRNGPWSDGEESVFHVLHCSFCNGRTCPTENECMLITVDEVFDAVKRRLARSSAGVGH